MICINNFGRNYPPYKCYLPENTQGLICQPLGKDGVLILGANAPCSYRKKDENWLEGIADQLSETLSQNYQS